MKSVTLWLTSSRKTPKTGLRTPHGSAKDVKIYSLFHDLNELQPVGARFRESPWMDTKHVLSGVGIPEKSKSDGAYEGSLDSFDGVPSGQIKSRTALTPQRDARTSDRRVLYGLIIALSTFLIYWLSPMDTPNETLSETAPTESSVFQAHSSPNSPVSVGPICPNGMLEPGEACDDGNTVNTDICTNRCESNLSYLNGETPVHRHFVMGGQDPIGANDMGVLSPYTHMTISIGHSGATYTPYLLNPYFILRNEVTRRLAGVSRILTSSSCSSPQLELRNDLSQHPRRPMTEVTLTEARAYCRWLGGDLPNEAHREFAARSNGRPYTYPWGNEPLTCRRAITGDPTCQTPQPISVCSRPMGNSAQGACDLSGNVWEWVLPLFPTLSEMTKWPTIFRRRTSRIEWPNDDVHSSPWRTHPPILDDPRAPLNVLTFKAMPTMSTEEMKRRRVAP